jgi:hypothetical protein
MPIIELDPNSHVCAGQWLKVGLASIRSHQNNQT